MKQMNRRAAYFSLVFSVLGSACMKQSEDQAESDLSRRNSAGIPRSIPLSVSFKPGIIPNRNWNVAEKSYLSSFSSRDEILVCPRDKVEESLSSGNLVRCVNVDSAGPVDPDIHALVAMDRTNKKIRLTFLSALEQDDTFNSATALNLDSGNLQLAGGTPDREKIIENCILGGGKKACWSQEYIDRKMGIPSRGNV